LRTLSTKLTEFELKK